MPNSASNNVLVINASGSETRVALVENGVIAEYYLDRKRDRGIVGNIYKGRVVRVLPGMQAAFVDIGLEKAAFLYVSDVFYDPEFSEQEFDLTEGEHGDHEEPPAPEQVEAAEAEAAAAVASPPAGEEPRTLPAEAAPPAPAMPSEVAAEEAAAAAAEDADELEDDEDEDEEAATVEGAPASEAPPEAAAEAPAAGESRGALEAPRPAQAAREVPVGPRSKRRRRRRRGKGRPGDAKPHADANGAPASSREAPPRKGEPGRSGAQAQIQDLLKEGQEIIVQVVKDPIGTKGARITSHISLPGRHLVFMPTVDHVGISRRIDNEKERRRLRDIVNRMRPPGTGFIVRTVAENVSEEKLAADIRFLIQVWNEVGKEKDKKPAPALLHPDLDMVLRATRDLFTHDVGKLVIDDREEYERVLTFMDTQEQSLKEHVELYVGEEPIFDAYGIEQEVKRALNRKVWLKSGGYIIIDQAEALVAIDVNSGRYVGKKNLEETITRINVEAAKEIVYQLRLRNIGGIIIIDFIDMDKPQNRDKVFKAMQEALGRDRAKTNVLRISELGLIEMTRKRVRESLGRTLNEPCSYCDGKGFVRSKVTVAYDIFRELRREAPSFSESVLVINCHPEVAKLISTEERDELRHLMDRCNKSVQVKAQPSYHQEQFDIHGVQVRAQSRPPAASGATP
ncbi:MAG TPA: Rne/Rng family ribonuclease [Myxococcales bacterium]|nr:Rne/Rng family ribonuclease [Myxococcales bacterium]